MRDLGDVIMVVIGNIQNIASLYAEDYLVWWKILIVKKRENKQGKELIA